jgi:hypothetical protein
MAGTKLLPSADIFFGDANSAEARVYARVPGDRVPMDCVLTGRVVGPVCEYSRTLSATVPFVARRSAGASDDAPLLAEAIVPDPCFWSQDLPFLYRAEVELRRGSEVLEADERTFGIRPLGVRARSLAWEGRPWVLRAADQCELPEYTLQEWRAADLAVLVENPNDELCQEASRLGTVLVADLSTAMNDLARELQRLARWPAVAVALLSAGSTLPSKIHDAAKNLLLAEHRGQGTQGTPSAWADLVVCDDDSIDEFVERTAGLSLPVIAQRLTGWSDTLDDARRHCDRLQRDLAGRGDFAGYIV